MFPKTFFSPKTFFFFKNKDVLEMSEHATLPTKCFENGFY
jgi:hypothetical protein